MAPVCENLDFEVFTDEKWLEFILGQLIQNSIKYAREDGAKIVFSGALLDEGLASERIELTVADNGCGVCAADLPRGVAKGVSGANRPPPHPALGGTPPGGGRRRRPHAAENISPAGACGLRKNSIFAWELRAARRIRRQ